MKALIRYFSRLELVLWSASSALIILSFLIFDRTNYITLLASMIGVTSLIFSAKGNPVGQALMILFSLFYGYISYTFSYYGEMITYLGMTMPMAVFSLISWLRHPFDGKRSEVRVAALHSGEHIFMLVSGLCVTVAFYFILRYFGTASLIPSTASVTTSFIAAYLTLRRSPYFALAYAANDAVLILLWTVAAMQDIRYISVVVCFVAFLFNDVYGFVSWRKMKERQCGCA